MSSKQSLWIIIAGVTGFLGVAIGAFGAHGLEGRLSEKMLATFHTGVLYHLIHAVVLLALALNYSEKFSLTLVFILTGIILFSFSLYIYSVTGLKFFAMITPLGGLSFLIGWGLIAFKAFR
ncbi:MAG: DUF423 domain-containing protein [Methanococcaceae archaeon]